MEHDNENLKLLYDLNGNRPYRPSASWTCVKEFKISYPNIERMFRPDPLLKLERVGGFEPLSISLED